MQLHCLFRIIHMSLCQSNYTKFTPTSIPPLQKQHFEQ
uniref:Uncharacterized protein n=1 Tax=Anguilla anguilla TaxID=7936 RepID=A0A0E9WT82_ANGAN